MYKLVLEEYDENNKLINKKTLSEVSSLTYANILQQNYYDIYISKVLNFIIKCEKF